MIVVHAKCTRSSAATVVRRPRFRSSQPRVVQSIVRNASRSTGHHAGTNICEYLPDNPRCGFPEFFLFINL